MQLKRFIQRNLATSFSLGTLLFIFLVYLLWKNRTKVVAKTTQAIDLAANTSKNVVEFVTTDPATGKTVRVEKKVS